MFGQKLPAPGNAVIFVIIAQAPVAQHFKHGQMRVVADFINVGGAQNFLEVGQALAARVNFTQQIRHQRMHAGGGKQHRRIMLRHQGSRRDNGVVFGLKKFQEFSPNCVGSHPLHCNGKEPMRVYGRFGSYSNCAVL